MDADGVMKGEIDLGNVATLDLTNGVVWKEHEQSYAGIVSMDAKKPANQKWTVKFTPEERSKENMAMFFLSDPNLQKGATPSQFAQTMGVVASQDITIYLDRWMDLGKKYIKPGTIEINTDPLTSELDCGEYRIDYENGLLMICSNQDTYTDEQETTIAFEYGTCALAKFIPRTTPIIGQLRYRGTSEVGPRHEIVAWKVQISPDAALGLIKPQEFAGLSFSGDVFRISDACSDEQIASPFFRIVELDDSAITYPS
jgi:hypothetical protein